MDLSTDAKDRRDQVEGALFPMAGLIRQLEEIEIRIDATMKVWSETRSALEPAMDLCGSSLKEARALQEKVAELWKEGYVRKWKQVSE